MKSFHFAEGGSELLDSCNNLWELFISSQAQNAGEMSIGVEEYIRSLKDGGLLEKTQDGKLYVQIVKLNNEIESIGFCVTSLTKDLIGEVDVIYIIDRYQGNKVGGQLLQNALNWMEKEKAKEQRLVVATGNEKVFSFYAKYGLFPGYTTLFRVN